MAWLQTRVVYALLVVAPSGLTSQLSLHASLEACEAARDIYKDTYTIMQPLTIECKRYQR